MASRHDLPDFTYVIVQHDRGWIIWLVLILAGVLGVFALSALTVSLLIHG
jgi:hypothetical protein